ncbi:ankyrin repeat domain-containing protein 40-like [Mya arenaria]|uniref:ankyrin repeat domain-containing protein 40-like n=1 Tax=Mya arenaria TaxID=6604 RepID=UPI0022E40A99|nr:ankyrin repeat domain-containing protein 40-like [Mya arenaria]
MNVEAAEKEEKLRESACIGDLDQVIKLVEHDHVNVNSQNNINGWTALHWACKRNHIDIVKYLLAHGADNAIQNTNKELAAQLTNTAEIRHILDYSGGVSEAPSFAITPSYLKFPVFPYASRDPVPPAIDSQHHAPALVNGHTGPTLRSDPNELVLKARVAYLTDRDFIEVELSRQTLTFEALLTMLTRELGVDRSLVHKIRKLPDTVLRKDKDVARLVDFQEVELVLTNRAMSSSSRGYASDLSDSFKHEQILY